MLNCHVKGSATIICDIPNVTVDDHDSALTDRNEIMQDNALNCRLDLPTLSGAAVIENVGRKI